MDVKLITVAETTVFQRQANTIWTDAERFAFIDYIASAPEAGEIIPDTGGIRKVRWSRAGSGKRGGVRVIYYVHDATMPLYLLLVYAKSQQENWTPAERARARQLVEAIRDEHEQRKRQS